MGGGGRTDPPDTQKVNENLIEIIYETFFYTYKKRFVQNVRTQGSCEWAPHGLDSAVRGDDHVVWERGQAWQLMCGLAFLQESLRKSYTRVRAGSRAGQFMGKEEPARFRINYRLRPGSFYFCIYKKKHLKSHRVPRASPPAQQRPTFPLYCILGVVKAVLYCLSCLVV